MYVVLLSGIVIVCAFPLLGVNVIICPLELSWVNEYVVFVFGGVAQVPSPLKYWDVFPDSFDI